MKQWFRTWFRLGLVTSALWIAVTALLAQYVRRPDPIFFAGLAIIWVAALGVPWVFAGFSKRRKPTDGD